MATRLSPLPNEVLLISCGAGFSTIPRTPKRRPEVLLQRLLESWPLPILHDNLPQLRVSDLLCVAVLCSNPSFKDRVKDPNSDTRATVVSAIHHTLRTSCSLLSVLTFSLMSDENLVRISLFW